MYFEFLFVEFTVTIKTKRKIISSSKYFEPRTSSKSEIENCFSLFLVIFTRSLKPKTAWSFYQEFLSAFLVQSTTSKDKL